MPTCLHSGSKFKILRELPLPFDKWEGIIYWYIEDWSTGKLSIEHQENIFQNVFAEWNKHFAPLEFRRTHNIKDALIKIHFSGYRLGLFSRIITKLIPSALKYFRIEPIPFDNPGLLGYAYEYGSNYNPCNLYINDRYDWLDGEYSLFLVAMHEIGHIFNIGHTQINHDLEIMQEFYEKDMTITQDSIDAIDHLYGDLKTKFTHVITTKNPNT